uniref:Cytochrome c oxidase assembly factor 3 mitochondrial coiled-coil domain-containing protein n=1 Tax=Oryza punctata TaxID=4537 RepID=A0A0E0KXG8_ORYPU
MEVASAKRRNHIETIHASCGIYEDIEDEEMHLETGDSKSNRCKLKMAGFGSLASKTKNIVVAGGLSAFVLGVYYYTMRAVGGTDELQPAISCKSGRGDRLPFASRPVPH